MRSQGSSGAELAQHSQTTTLHNAPVKRWDGSSRLSSGWDHLRKDPELWLQSSDCFVHLYPEGASQRGPSFLLPYAAISDSIIASTANVIHQQISTKTEDDTIFRHTQTLYEIHLPAPELCPKEDAFEWHIVTRNFLAFVSRKPLVGKSLGLALVALYDRLNLWRPHHDNSSAILEYAHSMRYRDMAHCPDYAIAMLLLADRLQNDQLWVDAFTHCVGMNDMLYISSELQFLPEPTRTAIKLAAADTLARVQQAANALGSLLEVDLSPDYIGLSTQARAHLDTFRDFLTDFYSRKFGAWPPTTIFPISVYKSMLLDFQCLYEYLVDFETTSSLSGQPLASGGICVLQTLRSFDERNRHQPLDHPQPQLPASAVLPRRGSSHGTLSKLRLTQKPDVDDATRVSLSLTRDATNNHSPKVLRAPLVKAYQQLEDDLCMDKAERLLLSDGRKIRWLLIYGMLQTLLSITQAPRGVTDVDGPTYPLCCGESSMPYWKKAEARRLDRRASIAASKQILEKPSQDTLQSSKKGSSISPDCQTDDYNRHMEVKTSSWKDFWSVREPSTMAFKELSKQFDSSNQGKQRQAQSKKSTARPGTSSKLSILNISRSRLGTSTTSPPSSAPDSWATFMSNQVSKGKASVSTTSSHAGPSRAASTTKSHLNSSISQNNPTACPWEAEETSPPPLPSPPPRGSSMKPLDSVGAKAIDALPIEASTISGHRRVESHTSTDMTTGAPKSDDINITKPAPVVIGNRVEKIH